MAGHYEGLEILQGGWGGVPGSLTQLSRAGSPMASMTGGMLMSGPDSPACGRATSLLDPKTSVEIMALIFER
jgi:hypothetical protein